jgi:hypothetical protein
LVLAPAQATAPRESDSSTTRPHERDSASGLVPNRDPRVAPQPTPAPVRQLVSSLADPPSAPLTCAPSRTACFRFYVGSASPSPARFPASRPGPSPFTKAHEYLFSPPLLFSAFPVLSFLCSEVWIILLICLCFGSWTWMIYSYDVVCFLCLDNWIGYKLLWLVGGGCLHRV